MTYGMLIDLKKCIGCHACAVACKEAHGTPPKVTRAHVEIEYVGEYPDVRMTAYPMLCMHCENAPCVEVCPTGASFKREDGIVAINKDECIGCKSCMSACPYGARYYREDENGYFCENELRMFRMVEKQSGRLRDEAARTLREYVLQVRELFQAEIDIRQNRIMKTLAIVTTIFLPLSLVAGWNGMNFVDMLKLRWRYGYPAVTRYTKRN